MSTPPPAGDDLETVARLFHDTYEELAPSFSYSTRKASAVPWEQVPENNRRLMIATVERVLAALEAVRSTREGEIERLRKFAEWCVSDDFDSRDLDILALEALNQGTPNVG